MKFKIDTNPSYTRILPEDGPVNATMAALLTQKCQEVQAEKSRNLIVDFSQLPDSAASDAEALFAAWAQLHEIQYEKGYSLILTGFQPLLLAQIKRAELHYMLNITPTLIEAIDMVNMEMLERDLFNEEP